MLKTISKLLFLLGTMIVAGASQAVELKIAATAPHGSTWMNSLTAAAKDVEQKTEGRVSFKFYGGGVMGDDAVVLRKIRVRQLHGGIVQTGALSASTPIVSLYNLPMHFRNFDEVASVREVLDHELEEGLEANGYAVLGIPALGFAYAMSTDKAQTIQDARKLKVWSPKGDRMANRVFKAFGVTPVPLSQVDVLTGLQTGLINTVAAPPVGVVALQWHTQIDYMLDLPFMYIYSVFVLDQRQFERLSTEDQKVVKDIFAVAVQESELQNIADHKATMDVLLDRGVELVKPSDDERAEWQAAADVEASNWMNDDIIPERTYMRLKEVLQQVRSN